MTVNLDMEGDECDERMCSKTIKKYCSFQITNVKMIQFVNVVLQFLFPDRNIPEGKRKSI